MSEVTAAWSHRCAPSRMSLPDDAAIARDEAIAVRAHLPLPSSLQVSTFNVESGTSIRRTRSGGAFA
jgi:hypothetical protein